MTTPEQSSKPSRPGLFARVVAFFVDSIVVQLAGVVLGLPFMPFLSRLGALQWLPGLLVFLAYFTIQDSSPAGSFGKRALKIKVVGRNSGPPTKVQAFARALILLVAVKSSPIQEWVTARSGAGAQTVELVIFTVVTFFVVGMTVFPLFHPQRRALHDVLTGTSVTPIEAAEPVEPLAFVPRAVVPSAIALVALIALLKGLQGSDLGKEITGYRETGLQLQTELGLERVQVGRLTTTQSGQAPVTTLTVEAWVPAEDLESESARRQWFDKLDRALKRRNSDPNVTRISVRLHANHYYGFFPVDHQYNDTKALTEIPE